MNIKILLILFAVFALLTLNIQKSVADTIYQWTDADGIVHFSDIPPVDNTIKDTQEINIEISQTEAVDPEKYSIINQADRMTERRRQLTEQRLEKKRLQLEAKRLALEYEQSQQITPYSNQEIYQPAGYVGYYQPYYYPGRGDGYYPKRHGYSKSGYGRYGYGHHSGKSFQNNGYSGNISRGHKTSRVTFNF